MKKISIQKQNATLIFAFMAFALAPDLALAGAASTPWDNVLNTIIGWLNSGTLRLIAILVIIGLGFAAWANKLTLGRAGAAIGGIILVFGGAAIADLFIAGVG